MQQMFILNNHVDLNISYHSGEGTGWGESFGANGEKGGRIVCESRRK